MLVLTILFMLILANVLAICDIAVYCINYVRLHYFGCVDCGPISDAERTSLTTSVKVVILSILVYFAMIGVRVVLGLPVEELE